MEASAIHWVIRFHGVFKYMFYFTFTWGDDPIWRSYFSDGLVKNHQPEKISWFVASLPRILRIRTAIHRAPTPPKILGLTMEICGRGISWSYTHVFLWGWSHPKKKVDDSHFGPFSLDRNMFQVWNRAPPDDCLGFCRCKRRVRCIYRSRQKWYGMSIYAHACLEQLQFHRPYDFPSQILYIFSKSRYVVDEICWAESVEFFKSWVGSWVFLFFCFNQCILCFWPQIVTWIVGSSCGYVIWDVRYGKKFLSMRWPMEMDLWVDAFPIKHVIFQPAMLLC